MLRIFYALLFLIAAGASAESDVHPQEMQKGQAQQQQENINFHAASFEFGAILAFQDAGDSQSGEVNWAPHLDFGDSLGLRARIGGTFFRANPAGFFFVGNAEVFVVLPVLAGFSIEGGGGVQYWMNEGGLQLLGSGNLAWKPPVPLLGTFDRFYVGYSAYTLSGLLTHEFRGGIGFSF